MFSSFLRHTIVQNALLAGFSLLVALLVAEIALRAISRDPTAPDPILGHVHTSGGEWDEKGFRNPHALEQAHIVAIGDSQTEGNNAKSEESWPLVLGELAGTTTYNMGVPGYGPVQYAVIAERAAALQPKHVVLGLYLGNDLMDAERVAYDLEHWSALRNPSYVRVEQPVESTDFRTILGSGVQQDSFAYKVLKLRMWIRGNSRVYALLGNATRSLREKLNLAATRDEKQAAIKDIASERPDLAYVYDSNPKFETVLSPTYRLDTVGTTDPRAAEGWRITQDRLRAIQTTVDAMGADLSVVIIPTKEMVYIDYMEHRGETVPVEFGPYAASERGLTAEIKAFCEAEHINCLSLLPKMTQAMVDGVALYGTTMDGHPNANGYRIIAEIINAHIAIDTGSNGR